METQANKQAKRIKEVIYWLCVMLLCLLTCLYGLIATPEKSQQTKEAPLEVYDTPIPLSHICHGDWEGVNNV